MQVNNSGLVVSISSVGDRSAFPDFLSDYTGKTAIEAVLELMKTNLDRLGLRIKLVEPRECITCLTRRSMFDKFLNLMTFLGGLWSSSVGNINNAKIKWLYVFITLFRLALLGYFRISSNLPQVSSRIYQNQDSLWFPY